MKTETQTSPHSRTRRSIIQGLLVWPAIMAVACSKSAADALTSVVSSPTSPTSLNPTPACADDDDDPTPSQTEGPYFKPSSPLRSSLLESGTTGTKLVLTGQVLSTACAAISGALLDFWQADNAGNYDLSGFKLRGHQFTDAAGRFSLETIVPGLYPGRTRHIHVKVQAPNGPILTTQLYFPGEARNASDGIFSSALLMNVTSLGSEQQATFNFVVA